MSVSPNEAIVAISKATPPPTIETSAVADFASTSTELEVNITSSPTAYSVPESSTTTELICPRLTSSTTISAKLLPKFSNSTVSF